MMIMPTQQPLLLIGSYDSIADVKERICTNRLKPLDTSKPASRCRGTVVQAGEEDGAVTLIGWQRNAARLQKMDVSLPAIVTLRLRRIPSENAYRIVSIDLDKSFRGSKGLLCCGPYLDKNMKNELVGQAFDASLFKKTKLNAMRCFHLVEILHAMISYFGTVSGELSGTGAKALHFEEENTDYMEDDEKRSCCCGIHLVSGREAVFYRLVIADLFEKVRFSKEGVMTCRGSLTFEFFLGDQRAIAGEIPISESGSMERGFQKMLLECIRTLQAALGVGQKEKIRFTNLYPMALVGLLTQTLAIRHFSNNYHYIMHALTGLQRRDGIPLCIGASMNMNEVKRYFPGFSSDDLKG
jgi:hypothetical protein